MDAKIYKGGTPVIQFPFCEGQYAQYEAPFIAGQVHDLEPYRSHADGAYQIGYFTLGMPIVPKWMQYQRDALDAANLAVDDIIQCIWIPADHYAKFLNFKVMGNDANLAGASVVLTAQRVTRNTNGDYVYTEINDVENAAAAQNLSTPIKLDVPSNTMLSLMRMSTSVSLPVTGSGPAVAVPGTVSISGEANGYVIGYSQPLYSGPDSVVLLGLKVVSLPTNPEVKLSQALNGFFMSVKIEGFECPTQL